MFDSLKSALATQIKRNRTRNELSRLSDRELRDLGISRYDIPSIIREIN